MSYTVLNPGSGQAIEVSLYPSLSDFPSTGYPCSLAIALDTQVLYLLSVTMGWIPLASGVETDPFAIRRDNLQPPLVDISWAGFRILSLRGTTSPDTNLFYGTSAGAAVTSGTNNTFLGNSAGILNTTGYDNTFVGEEAGKSNLSGDSNVFIGKLAGRDNSTAGSNVFVGTGAGRSTTTGTGNVFMGHLAGSQSIIGQNNVYIGNGAGYSGTGERNIKIGTSAGFSATSGDRNILIGYGAEPSAPTASDELVLGTFLTGDASNLNAATRNLRITTAGKGLQVKTGSNAKIGQSTLVGGTIAVANTGVTANSRIFITVSAPGGTQGFLSVASNPGVGFTINSDSVLETSTVDWFIVESIP